VTSTKQFIWCGSEMCEVRDATGTNVTNRFYPQGEQISGTNYYFTRDHLGSVSELTDSSGVVHSSYSYDPYGNTEVGVTEDGPTPVIADFMYAGYYEHGTSGLYLTQYRAYDTNTARWLSRDPAGEMERSDGRGGTVGGLNLYDYVDNSPVDWVDLLGLGHGSGLGPNGQPPTNNNGSNAQQNAAMGYSLASSVTDFLQDIMNEGNMVYVFQHMPASGVNWTLGAAGKTGLYQCMKPYAPGPAAVFKAGVAPFAMAFMTIDTAASLPSELPPVPNPSPAPPFVDDDYNTPGEH